MRIVPLLLILSLTVSSAAAGNEPADLLDKILEDSVVGERIDYGIILPRHRRPLMEVLDQYARTDPASLEKDDRLAYYINLYNATMILAVLDNGHEKFKASDNDFAVFKSPRVRMAGKTLSLNELENNIIRKEFADPRIHAALVCAAVSCPPIIDEAYRGHSLDKQLNMNVQRWLANPNRNVIDFKNKTLKLSKIFEWYAEDFGGRENLAKWVGDKVGHDLAGYSVEFLEYDWSLNNAQ
ncbi:MAG TPA: DUF547 domain-containing protein [Tepidisphaeraceae bacterium]